jgi:hypothetical protein
MNLRWISRELGMWMVRIIQGGVKGIFSKKESKGKSHDYYLVPK